MNKLTRCIQYKQIFARSLYSSYLKVLPSYRYQSSQQSEAQILEQTLEEDIRKSEPRTVKRNPAILPFIKEIFCGRVNSDILAFPEFLNKTELESLATRVENVTKYISNQNHSDKDVINYLKKTNIFGAPASEQHGGLALLMTERCRIVEVLGSRYEVAMEVINQWSGIDCLNNGLPKEELDEILPKLTSGENSINIVLPEPEARFPEMPDITCKAKSTLNSGWVLDGEKIFMEKDLKDRYLVVLGTVTRDVAEPFLVLPNAQNITHENSILKLRNTEGNILTITLYFFINNVIDISLYCTL